MASLSPPPFHKSWTGFVKASRGCPSYWGSRSGFSVCTRAGELSATGQVPLLAQARSWCSRLRSAPTCGQWQPRPRMQGTSGSPVQPQRPRSRGSSPRRGEDLWRAPEDAADPSAAPAVKAAPAAEAAPASKAAPAAEAAQAVVPRSQILASISTNGKWMATINFSLLLVKIKFLSFFVKFLYFGYLGNYIYMRGCLCVHKGL